jgi:hypothetical protein
MTNVKGVSCIAKWWYGEKDEKENLQTRLAVNHCVKPAKVVSARACSSSTRSIRGGEWVSRV